MHGVGQKYNLAGAGQFPSSSIPPAVGPELLGLTVPLSSPKRQEKGGSLTPWGPQTPHLLPAAQLLLTLIHVCPLPRLGVPVPPAPIPRGTEPQALAPTPRAPGN